MIKVAIDTNVLMDYLFEGRPCKEEAKTIMLAGSKGLVDICVSTQSIIDAAYMARKHGVEYARFQQVIAQLRVFLRITAIDEIDLCWALTHHTGDFEDDMQYASAYNNVCDYFITRDKELQNLNDPLCPMTVITPDDFVAAMQSA